MAAPHNVDPAQLLEEHLASASPDVLREMVAALANAMMSAQADQVCGAGDGERSTERTNRRNGYRSREWDTRAGAVELAVPKLRHGSYFPDWLLTHRRRAEQALVTVVATAYLLGVDREPPLHEPGTARQKPDPHRHRRARRGRRADRDTRTTDRINSNSRSRGVDRIHQLRGRGVADTGKHHTRFHQHNTTGRNNRHRRRTHAGGPSHSCSLGCDHKS
jgi:Transposase, Mutator family